MATATAEAWHWAVFAMLVGIMLAVDLIVSHRGGKAGLRSAAIWSAIWIGVGLLFGLWLALAFAPQIALTYLAAYLLEKSLSVDNLFVFVLVFSQLQIPSVYQHRVLFWGIMSALVMRAVMIALGVYLLERFHWVIYPFAAWLLLTALRLLLAEGKERALMKESCAACNTWVARFVPVNPTFQGGQFFVKDGGRKVATPLFIALVIIETTDVIFAIDSIPAVLAITRDPFLVYTSNVFAILGLRSLYFLLAGVIERFRYLRPGLAVILVFIAAKMLLESVFHIPVMTSLAVIVGVFVISLIMSRLTPAKN